MKEYTIYAVEKEGHIGGLGFNFPPSTQEINGATASYIFRRGSVRIHVLVITGRVTLDEARQLAINFYEGKGKEVNFNDAAHIDRNATLWRQYFTS